MKHAPHQALWLQWLLLAVALLALVGGLSQPGQLQQSNAWLQDRITRSQARPAAPEVVLVLADDRSIASIGRWPWRRALHAQVLRHISAGQPQSIGLDFLLTEEDLDYPEDDLLLAHTMAASGRVVLPVVPIGGAGQEALLPLPLLAQAAAALGHTAIEPDSDGSVRRFHPWQQATTAAGGMLWPHFTIAMQCVEHPQQAPCQRLQRHQRPPEAQALPPASSLIGFASRHPPFTRYAYIDVLQGRIPSGAFRNKHVLIGSNATGVATTAATPGAPEQAMMSNVELLAHTLHSQLQPRALHPASTSSNVALNLALVGAGLLAVLLLSPSSALVACAALAVLALGITWASASLWGSVLQPMAALLGLAMAYPLWSWRRQTAALGFFQAELRALQQQSSTLLPGIPRRRGDFLQQHIVQVQHALQHLQHLQAQREQAMRFISHDIRAPISTLLTEIDLERHGLLPADGPPLLDRIERHAHSALRLADDFVHLARTLEQPSTRRERVELGLLMDQAQDDMWASATRRNIQLVWLAQEQEALVRGDPSQLRRVLVNVLSNAIKYSPQGSSIDLQLSYCEGHWCIAILDQGPGMDAQALPHLFTPFVRQKRHEGEGGHEPVAGIGLGLAYVQAVVAQHGGQVQAANRPEGGAVFTITLPAA